MHGLISTLFPQQASNLAPGVDSIFFALVALCGGMTLLVKEDELSNPVSVGLFGAITVMPRPHVEAHFFK